MPSFLASIIGYSIFGTADITWEIVQIPLFLLLGVSSAFVGLLYIKSFYGARKIFSDFFEKNNLPKYLKPVSGAFFIAIFVLILAHLSPYTMLAALGSLGTGYGFIQLAIYNMLPLTALIILPFAKILTTSLTIGSGGSGGVFAPGLAIGGAAGGALGMILHNLIPNFVPLASVPAFVIVGMIALFGGIANAPISVMIMVVEMTSDFSLLVPAMGAVAVSCLITGENTIFRKQVKTKAQSSAHRGEYQIEILEEITAGSAMKKFSDLIYLSPKDPCQIVFSTIDRTRHTGFPVIDNGQLVGIVTHRDIQPHKEDNLLISDIMNTSVYTLNTDSNLEEALSIMIENEIHHIPVVDNNDPKILLGFITSTDIMRSYTKKMTLDYKSVSNKYLKENLKF